MFPVILSRKDFCEKAAPPDLASCAYPARKKDAEFDPSADPTATAHQKPTAEPSPSQGPTSECGCCFLLPWGSRSFLEEEDILILVFSSVFLHDL